MAKSSSRTMSVVATVLGLMMAVSGLTKLTGESHQVAMFAMVGLPNWFLALVGTFEVIGGILLLVPAATPIGSLILSTIMVGALWAHAAEVTPDNAEAHVNVGWVLHKQGKLEEAVERYVVPDRYKNYRQFSWGFCIGRTIEQFYAEWSGKPGHVLNYS